MQKVEQLTIFTVDDSEIVYRNIGSILTEGKNCNWVGHAFTIADAYTQIAEKKPKVVVLDIHLKEGTSFELLEYLSKNHPNIVIIMFTNISTEPYREKCKKLGAKYFLDKSADFERIPLILEDLLLHK